MVRIQRINVWSATAVVAAHAENYLKKTEVAIGASAQEEQVKEPANTSGLTKTVSVVAAAVTSEEGRMPETMCATCGGIDGHYPWCAVGQLNADVAELGEAVAAKDRRIAELEAENERLRKAIANAPHDPMCGTRFVWDKPRCNCWKLAALAGEVE